MEITLGKGVCMTNYNIMNHQTTMVVFKNTAHGERYVSGIFDTKEKNIEQ
jgi:hypothetical protein